MQPRLMRSRTESIFAGVCGGLGDYFGVDPVIVRLIFVLVTLTTGLGLLIYPVLWLSMPKAPERRFYGDAGLPQLDAQEQMPMGAQQAAPYVMQEARSRGQAATSHRSAVPPPEAYNFDPLTGQPIQRDPSTGSTTMLNDQLFDQNPISPAGAAPAPRGRVKRWSIAGVVLLGFGLMALAEAVGISTEIVFPILMIVGGLALLRRR